jgi:hypothetical protein
MADGSLGFGLGRMYEQLVAGRTGNEIRVFRSLEEAIAWLGSSQRAAIFPR